ncbi:peptidoglycan-binding protein [Maricaulis parjimensis]|uniref:peptidoglycan-binding protein n=1 Tax=Maricaulis parjimensis TaxID=144023 RepID=UPI001939D0C8
MTLGEWINRVILEDSDPSKAEWDDALESFPGFGGGSALNEEDDRLLRAMVNRLTERVENTEQRSARTLSGLDKAITQLAEKISRSSDRQSAELQSAQATLDRVRKSHEELADRLRQVEAAGPASNSPEDRAAFETTIMKLARRLYEHENDIAARLHELDTDARSASESLEARLARLEARADDYADLDRKRQDRTTDTLGQLTSTTEALKARVEGAERITNDAARALDTSVSRLDDRLRHLETRNSSDTVDLERRFERLSEDVARVIADTRSQMAKAMAGAASEPRIDRLEDALTRAMARMDEAERRQGDSMSRLGQEITKLAGAIDRRLTESERRAADALRESQNESKLDRRLDEVRQESRDAIRRMGEDVTRLGRSLADRIDQSETRASQVVENATDRMAQMLDKIESRRSSEDELEDRLRQSEERTAQRIEDALGSVQERLSSVRDETEEALSPVQRAMSALADRLEAIEAKHAPKPEAEPEAQPEVKVEDKPIAIEPEEDIDFDTPLSPPPQAETPLGADLDEDDPFLAEAAPAPSSKARPAEPAPQPQPRPQAQPEVQPAAAAMVLQPAPVQPEPAPQARAPRPAAPTGRIGATADSDFLAAARQRTRAPGQPAAQATSKPRKPSRLGRTLLYTLPVFALAMLSGAGALLVWEAWKGDAERVAVEAQAERDFIAQVEAGLSEQPASAAPSESPAETPVETQAEAPAISQEPVAQAQPDPEPQTPPPSNVMADASGTMMPAAAEPVDAAPVTSAPARSQPQAPASSRETTLASAASDGNPVARYQLGMQALENGNPDSAAILLRRAAEQGVPSAQYRYAKLLETGEGVPQDLEAARRWTERAANAGHRRAMHNLGVMYYYGTGVAENLETAARWFQEAALLGLRDSQFNLALLYETGDGVPQSLPDAYAWFTIAANGANDPTARERAAALEGAMEPAALDAARSTAAGFTPRPIDAEANGIYQDLPWERTATTDVAAVRRAQGFLSVLGYAPGPIDGEMGARTREAIMQFEADLGLPRTGHVDDVLIERLERAAAG